MCQIIEDEIRELIANGTDADDISQKLSRYFPSVFTDPQASLGDWVLTRPLV